ncbi:hypothetical protein ACE38W_19490 [Chitinophaga sp. Hz27]|uniref:hypothetical protein n=1 Tax=Chitinophaga sp. Hz27 TaxID=3347169 RepID=UPI0035DFC9A8
MNVAQAQVSSRTYATNLAIPGETLDGTGINYLLLHVAYDNQFIPDHHVFGKISGLRGNEGSWNRKWVVEVNTSSAYNLNRGSLIAYLEPSKLVTLYYQGIKYMALSIAAGSLVHSFAFTGWTTETGFKLVTYQEVTNVKDLEKYEPITIPTQFVIDNSGTALPKDKYQGDAFILHSATGGMAITVPTYTESIFSGHHITFESPNFKGGMGISVGQDNSAFLQAFSTSSQDGNIFLNPNGGSVGIGVHDTKGHKLAVGGDIIAEKVIVKSQTNWPDYVFEHNYHLPTLQEVSAYINSNKHLPDMPAAAQIKGSGIDLEAMNAKLLQKVEELTLYLIQLDNENKVLKEEVKEIKESIKK